MYDETKAQRAIQFINCLKHTKGQWRGVPFELLPWQDKIIRDIFGTVKPSGYRQYNTAYIEIPKKNGKQLALSTPIPTPAGFTTMGELKVGDQIFDEKGNICNVVAISPIDDTEQAYKVNFRDGTTIVAGERHLWRVEVTNNGKREKILTTGEMYEKQNKASNKDNRALFRIRIADAFILPEKALPIDPYLYGYWLGNGNFHEKRIPDCYLRASIEQRQRLLQGLMDSDGCVSKNKGQAIYVTILPELAKDIQNLLWSLGIKNTLKTTPSRWLGELTGETCYLIRFTAFDTNNSRSHYHYIKSIEKAEACPMRCIQVDSPSRLYLAGRSMVPTHNSELAAAVALYMTCGDNEWGAEVYGCASDRQQASIVFDVAVDMVDQCPALKKRIKPVISVKRLVYQPTNSFYQVLSAEAYTKHGLNVHAVVFDELHAQPSRDLYDVMTKGSGDARTQPLFFLITTAGTDRNSICWEVHQKALDILAGRKIDPTFYPVIYGIDDDDDWTREENWYKANPSLGHTIDIEKVRAAFQSAKENLAEENLFRQLRLNQWVKQSVRWMQMDRWDECAFSIDLERLRGRICYGGLDLSSTTDITAFVLVFPPLVEDDKFIVLPYFWIPEDNLATRVRRDHVPYDIWQQQGYIKTTAGNVVHYGFIEAFIEELNTKYHIKEIAFDRWGAVQMVQNLEGMGFTVVPFGQGYKDMSPATKELMKLTLERKIAHGGNPVLRWMMDNIYVKTDPAGNIKPDKEKSTERIDGAVALIMALDRAIRNGGYSGSVYDERGILVL